MPRNRITKDQEVILNSIIDNQPPARKASLLHDLKTKVISKADLLSELLAENEAKL